MIRSITVLGLGHLGSPIAACLAASGFHVIGVDTDPEKVRAINERRAPVTENGLDEKLQAAENLEATTDTVSAVRRTDATFIIVPTPSRDDGGFSLDYVLPACALIGEALRDTEDHVVNLISTVLPTATGNEVREALEQASGKRAGEGFGLCYSPEFVALGSVLSDYLRPDLILIGESDERTGERLADVYRAVCENEPPVMRMNWVNAEIAKLSVNTFVTTKIAFANMLAEICDVTPGGDVDHVTGALGMDGRIGARYLTGGLGYGGPCFPRDNRALATFARSVGIDPMIPVATDRSNEIHAAHVVDSVRSHLGDRVGASVAVLGLAYKPGTDIVERSAGLELAVALADEGFAVVTYDPMAAGEARRRVDARVTVVDSLEACIRGSDAVIIATPWRSFVQDVPAALRETGAHPVVMDCWRILEPGAVLSAGAASYVALGRRPEASAAGG